MYLFIRNVLCECNCFLAPMGKKLYKTGNLLHGTVHGIILIPEELGTVKYFFIPFKGKQGCHIRHTKETIPTCIKDSQFNHFTAMMSFENDPYKCEI